MKSWLTRCFQVFAAIARARSDSSEPTPERRTTTGDSARRKTVQTPDLQPSIGPWGRGSLWQQVPVGSTTRRLRTEVTLDLGGGVQLELVLIPAGEFLMGDEKGTDDQKPVHRVVITQPFYLGKYPVTQEQWQAVTGRNPSSFQGPTNPVENVNWLDCQESLAKLNEKFGAEVVKLSLPTEAQWEYACRARRTTRYSFGDDVAKAGDYAWWAGNSGGTSHPVGEKKPNAWGLYDLYGNVWEWCADWFDADYYRDSPAEDPAGPDSGISRVVRGGVALRGPVGRLPGRVPLRPAPGPSLRWPRCSAGRRTVGGVFQNGMVQ